LSHLANYAYRRFPLRDVQPNVLLHHSCSESFDCESLTLARVSSRTSTAITSSFANLTHRRPILTPSRGAV
jgi:hypothetical protein